MNAGEEDSQVSERVEEDFEDEENVIYFIRFAIHNSRLMEIMIDLRIMNKDHMVVEMEMVVIMNR